MMWMPEREGRDGDAKEAAGQREGFEGVWYGFGLILYGNTPFSYVFTVSCAGLAFRSLLLPPEGAPA
jgi:hypothetical protein